MMIRNISVVIIAKNEAGKIGLCLDSLKEFEEIILYLNDSTDETEEIASKYKNVRIFRGDFMGFGPTKNKAATYSPRDWILTLDSDELITQELKEELESLKLNNINNVYRIKRNNYFLGKLVKHSGWGNDYLIRLYNRQKHAYNQNMVHERIETHHYSKIITLKNNFQHFAVIDINQFLLKIMHYSDLAAKDKYTKFFIFVILKSIFAFLKTYIFQRGFLDGWRGVVISVSNANGRFYRYTKRYINWKNKKKLHI